MRPATPTSWVRAGSEAPTRVPAAGDLTADPDGDPRSSVTTATRAANRRTRGRAGGGRGGGHAVQSDRLERPMREVNVTPCACTKLTSDTCAYSRSISTSGTFATPASQKTLSHHQ